VSDNEERIIELLTETNNHLDHIETLLDLLCQSSEDNAVSGRITAYRSLGFFARLRADWQHAGHVIEETEREAREAERAAKPQHHDLH
jgi:Fe2+ or Zn2+ uptake regulation protein